MAFMEMLRGARDPPISAQSTWPEVAAQFEADRRFVAIAEEQRVQMFDTFLEALGKVEEARALRRREQAAADFKVGSEGHTWHSCFKLEDALPRPHCSCCCSLAGPEQNPDRIAVILRVSSLL